MQSLVGISLRGRAVAGAVAIPFPDGRTDTPALVRFGIADVGDGSISAPSIMETNLATPFATALTTPLATPLATRPGNPPGGTGGTGGTPPGGTAPPPGGTPPSPAPPPVVLTGDSASALLGAATAAAVAAGCTHETAGGAGNKLLALADGRAALALMHLGTSLWDTCAPEV